MRLSGLLAATLAGVLAAGCTSGAQEDGAGGGQVGERVPGTSMRGQEKSASPVPSTSSRTADPSADSSAARPRFRAPAALRTVRELAGGGPREATSTAYARAADGVAASLTELGYQVRRQRFGVPAGESWGVRVPAGRTENVVAVPPGFDPAAPHVVVGAHLDTVPQSPGAEDNASGIGVLVETARVVAGAGTRLPTVFVAFGAEEPRGPGDDEHHFGSQTYVRRMPPDQRDALRAMVSLDRVGAPGSVPVCTGGRSPLKVRRQLLTAAAGVGVPARPCENRTSDHWPFEKAGETVARVGGNESPGYHSPRDRPSTVSRRQLDRVGRVLLGWLLTG